MQRYWDTYLATSPFEFTFTPFGDGVYSLVIEMHEPLGLKCGALLGEWLYNLRSALDYGLYDLAAHASGQRNPPSAKAIQFPVCENPDKFKKQAALRLLDLSEEHIEIIENAQPYKAHARDMYLGDDGNRPLARGVEVVQNTSIWQLHELARLDRHRKLSNVIATTNAHYGGVIFIRGICADEAGYHVEFSGGHLYEDIGEGPAEIRFKVTPHLPNDLTIDPNTSFSRWSNPR
jgi:hypothetical protein